MKKVFLYVYLIIIYKKKGLRERDIEKERREKVLTNRANKM